jgi:hypothetical protein
LALQLVQVPLLPLPKQSLKRPAPQPALAQLPALALPRMQLLALQLALVQLRA